ncbi:hypothetical protein F4805DRAFT_429862 [Annulohypoxylon moriforme]|nr:hypothetical protein F4805DRAFT_429862 [Annulohypoxylon moriforme]
MAGKTCVVVGIHFGVIETRVSWLTYGNNAIEHELSHIIGWPCAEAGSMNRMRCMVPSRISYDPEGNVTWGYDTPRDAQVIEHLPLLLYSRLHIPPDRDYTSHYDDASRICTTRRKDPYDVIVDYLHCVYSHAYQHIENQLTHDQFVKMPIHVVITTQGAWSTAAVPKLTSFVEHSEIAGHRQAGKTTFSIIPEMCAISIGTFLGPLRLDTVDMGDTFTVLSVDATTTNIVTYKVVEGMNPSMNLLILSDKTELFGPSILRKEFEARMQKKFSGNRFDTVSREGRDQMIDAWDTGMRTSGSTRTHYEELRIEVKTVPRKSNKCMTKAEIHEICNLITPQICSLVSAHVTDVHQTHSAVPKCLVVAGEVFANPYISVPIQETWQSLGGLITNTVLKAGGPKPEHGTTPTWLSIANCAALAGVVHLQLGRDVAIAPLVNRPIYMYP